MPVVLALFMMMCLVACGPRLGEQGPQRTKAAAEEKLSLLVSRSDRDIPSILVSEMGVHEATVVGTSYDNGGNKVTHLRWSHDYVIVSSRQVTTRKEVQVPPTGGVSVGGKPTLKHQSKNEATLEVKGEVRGETKGEIKGKEKPEAERAAKTDTTEAKKQWKEVTTTEYDRTRSTKPCDLYATSYKGFIESIRMEGEGCVW